MRPFRITASSATESSCGRYRFDLYRRFEGRSTAPLLGFVMLNPSTAGAQDDDPTIRRCMGFAWRDGAGGIMVANLCAYRATNPRELLGAHNLGADVVTDSNDDVFGALATTCQRIVLAWGATVGRCVWLRDRAVVVEMVLSLHPAHPTLLCLGKTKTGEVRHPLMVRKDQRLVPIQEAAS